MDVLWGIIILIVMYIVIPVAVIGGTLVLLGGGDRFLPPAMRRGRQPADTHADEAHPVGSGR
jgi:hypothetical protein